MSLRKRLEAIREASKEKMPAAARAVIGRATDDLRESGILATMLPAGSQVPRFTLPKSDGGQLSLEGELARGPVILSFFRGSW